MAIPEEFSVSKIAQEVVFLRATVKSKSCVVFETQFELLAATLLRMLYINLKVPLMLGMWLDVNEIQWRHSEN